MALMDIVFVLQFLITYCFIILAAADTCIQLLKLTISNESLMNHRNENTCCLSVSLGENCRHAPVKLV